RLRLNGKKPKDKAYPKKVTTIGDAIPKRRLELGLRQKDLAKIIGYDKTSVLNWKRAYAPKRRVLLRKGVVELDHEQPRRVDSQSSRMERKLGWWRKYVLKFFANGAPPVTNHGCKYYFFTIAGLGEAAGAAATPTTSPLTSESGGLFTILSDGVTPLVTSIVVPKSRPTLMSRNSTVLSGLRTPTCKPWVR